MLPNGHVLISASPAGTVVGGKYTFPGPTRIYEFDPTVANPTTANSYTNVTPSQAGFNLNQSSYLSCMLVLPNGNVLMCNDSGTIVEFTPTTGGPQDAWRPYIANITSIAFNIFHVTGNQLTGISEGSAYGDDNEMASNYPIVQLIDKNGNIKYGRTFNWTIGVAKTGTSQSFDFTLPSGWNPDAYLLTVSAAGISSGQVLNVQMGTATTANLTLQPQFSLPTLIDVVANGSIESIWSLGSFASVMVSGDTSADLIVVNDGSLGLRCGRQRQQRQ